MIFWGVKIRGPGTSLLDVPWPHGCGETGCAAPGAGLLAMPWLLDVVEFVVRFRFARPLCVLALESQCTINKPHNNSVTTVALLEASSFYFATEPSLL